MQLRLNQVCDMLAIHMRVKVTRNSDHAQLGAKRKVQTLHDSKFAEIYHSYSVIIIILRCKQNNLNPLIFSS